MAYKRQLQAPLKPSGKNDVELGAPIFRLYGNPLYTIVIIAISVLLMYPMFLQLQKRFIDFRILYWIGILLCIAVMIASLIFLSSTKVYQYGIITRRVFRKRTKILTFDEIRYVSYTKRKIASIRFYQSFYQWQIIGNHNKKQVVYTFEPSDFLWNRNDSMERIAKMIDELQIPIEGNQKKDNVKKVSF